MSIQLTGNYLLRVKFGKNDIPLAPSAIEEFTIVQDINKLLPMIKVRLRDVTGMLTHIVPFDKSISTIFVDLGSSISSGEKSNSFTFDIFTRSPESAQGQAAYYEFDGLLRVDNLFSPDYCRAFNQSISGALTSIAREMNITITDISPSLNSTKTLLQPRWSNSQFLTYHKDNVIGSGGESCFKCFISVSNGRASFVFRSIEEMTNKPEAFKFVLGDKIYHDYWPFFTYEIMDSYKIFGAFSAKSQVYSYFDYEKSELVSETIDAQRYKTLSDYFLIDGADNDGSNTITDLGRSNDFTPDFDGRVSGDFYDRLTSLVKMWIVIEGQEHIVPGIVVKILFPMGIPSGDVYTFQYSGFWLVERVVHCIGQTFRTKLLLTRQGIDTNKPTTLIKATNRKKV